MQITLLEKEQDTRILQLQGRMDASTVKLFDEAVQKCLAQLTRYIILDMAGLEYISSAGLRSVLVLIKSATAKQTALAFCGMQSMVAEVFDISGFSDMLAIYSTVDAALAAKR